VEDGDALRLLRQFSGRPTVDVLATDDPAIPGIRFGELDPVRDLIPVELHTKDGGWDRGVFAASSLLEAAKLYADEGLASEEELRRVLVLGSACASWGVDALVTGSHILSPDSPWKNLGRDANVMTAEEAIALLGLYLRWRGDYTYMVDGNFSQYFPADFFYRTVVMALLPEWGRWLGATADAADSRGQVTPLALAEAVVVRMIRALRGRDRLQRQFELVRNDDWGDALFYFDALLLSLGGAFDAIARVAHLAYSLPAKEIRFASWRRTEWVKAVRKADPDLGKLVVKGTPTSDTIELVALLRNTIHGQALSNVVHHVHGGSRFTLSVPDYIVALPPDVAADLDAAVGRRGGRERWHVRQLLQDADLLALDPGVYTEELLAECVLAMNRLMRGIDVERLGNVPAEPSDATSEQGDRDISPDLRLLVGFPHVAWDLRSGRLVR